MMTHLHSFSSPKYSYFYRIQAAQYRVSPERSWGFTTYHIHLGLSPERIGDRRRCPLLRFLLCPECEERSRLSDA